ncbi:hypothetical protein BX600DRAFT_442151 [Xylariales sp. PMI_506]|nr:hypothetical protein BX600DRAFT_442151 [Xylariales sp. PMI_506]
MGKGKKKKNKKSQKEATNPGGTGDESLPLTPYDTLLSRVKNEIDVLKRHQVMHAQVRKPCEMDALVQQGITHYTKMKDVMLANPNRLTESGFITVTSLINNTSEKMGIIEPAFATPEKRCQEMAAVLEEYFNKAHSLLIDVKESAIAMESKIAQIQGYEVKEEE